jgi:hypothetical protein
MRRDASALKEMRRRPDARKPSTQKDMIAVAANSSRRRLVRADESDPGQTSPTPQTNKFWGTSMMPQSFWRDCKACDQFAPCMLIPLCTCLLGK